MQADYDPMAPADSTSITSHVQDNIVPPIPTPTFAQQYLDRLTLARYAARIAYAQRRYPEKPLNPYRNEYQRDRDRILYCRAFRNLAHKTQVLPFPHSSFIRTRLTHTIEVAQIARTIARRLHLNEDLTEAIALGHDLGHAPFGHVGEDILRELLIDFGGFEHNEYSLRTVEEIEQLPDRPGHRGLNLTDHTRDGILKHTTPRDGVLRKILDVDKENIYLQAEAHERRRSYVETSTLLRPFLCDSEGRLKCDEEGYVFVRSTTLEGQVVDIADEIAYVTHDLEDARQALGISGDELIEFIPDYIELSHGLNRSRALTILIDGVIAETERQLSELDHDYDALEKVVVHHPTDLEPSVARLKAFFKERVYNHSRLRPRAKEAQSHIKKLCKSWVTNRKAIPEPLLKLYPRHAQLIDQARSESEILQAVCHLIASLTDLEVLDCYGLLFSPTFSIFDSHHLS